jgi:hypothetical protein
VRLGEDRLHAPPCAESRAPPGVALASSAMHVDRGASHARRGRAAGAQLETAAVRWKQQPRAPRRRSPGAAWGVKRDTGAAPTTLTEPRHTGRRVSPHACPAALTRSARGTPVVSDVILRMTYQTTETWPSLLRSHSRARDHSAATAIAAHARASREPRRTLAPRRGCCTRGPKSFGT